MDFEQALKIVNDLFTFEPINQQGRREYSAEDEDTFAQALAIVADKLRNNIVNRDEQGSKEIIAQINPAILVSGALTVVSSLSEVIAKNKMIKSFMEFQARARAEAQSEQAQAPTGGHRYDRLKPSEN